MSFIEKASQCLEIGYEDGDSAESLGERYVPELDSEVTFVIVFNKKINPSLSIDTPMTIFTVRLMGTEFTINDAKIREQLGYEPVTSGAEGLQQLNN